jgi:hypothetical protein
MTTKTDALAVPASVLDPDGLAPDLGHYQGPVVVITVDPTGEHVLDARWATPDFVLAVLARPGGALQAVVSPARPNASRA